MRAWVRRRRRDAVGAADVAGGAELSWRGRATSVRRSGRGGEGRRAFAGPPRGRGGGPALPPAFPRNRPPTLSRRGDLVSASSRSRGGSRSVRGQWSPDTGAPAPAPSPPRVADRGARDLGGAVGRVPRALRRGGGLEGVSYLSLSGPSGGWGGGCARPSGCREVGDAEAQRRRRPGRGCRRPGRAPSGRPKVPLASSPAVPLADCTAAGAGLVTSPSLRVSLPCASALPGLFSLWGRRIGSSFLSHCTKSEPPGPRQTAGQFSLKRGGVRIGV